MYQSLVTSKLSSQFLLEPIIHILFAQLFISSSPVMYPSDSIWFDKTLLLNFRPGKVHGLVVEFPSPFSATHVGEQNTPS